MARLFDADPTDFTRVSIPILKFERDPADGSVYVYGKATDATLDRDEQIIDPEFAAKSLRHWFETGANVRVMHSASLYPAGKGVELISKDDGQWLKSKVVEPTAIKLVETGVLSAYSVGIARPQIIRDRVAKGGRVVGGETVEVSLVDRPANPSCGVVLAKMAGGTLNLVSEMLGQLPADPDETVTISPKALVAALVKFGHATGAVTADGVKRDVDPDVGGGVDRDKLAAGDFVFGDERDFPVVKPGDVPDAVSSWGRYKGSKTFAEFKTKLTALARRKGEEFVAKLPDEWTKTGAEKAADAPEMTKDGTKGDPDCATCQDKGTIRDGNVDCPDCMAKGTAAELAKGAKDCDGCGRSHDADSDAKFCAGCGNKLPGAKADKAATPEVAKSAPDAAVEASLDSLKDAVRDAIGTQAKDPDAATDPADAKVSAHLEAAEAAVNAAERAQTEDMAGDAAEKAEKSATVSAGAEHVDLTRDQPVLTPVDGMALGLRRLHDATCAAYSWATVKQAHPGLAASGLTSVVAGAGPLLYSALARAYTEDAGRGEQATLLSGLAKAYEAAAALGDVGDVDIAQARADLYKAFRGANPDAPALTPLGGPKDPDPARWRRPYLNSGHAVDFAKPGQRPRIPAASHVPDAGQFDRPLITAGHQADSPANTTGTIRPVVTADGAPHPQTRSAPGEMNKGRTFYSNDAKGRALDVMKAMHDHIADVFPACCPMAPPTADQEYQPLASVGGTVDTRAQSGPKDASHVPDLLKGASPDLLKAAIAEVVAERIAEVRTDYETKIADLTASHGAAVEDLQTKFAELARQPDPAQAPFRGMAGLEQLLGKRAQEPPAAATARTEFYRDWLDSPDPAQREAARALLSPGGS